MCGNIAKSRKQIISSRFITTERQDKVDKQGPLTDESARASTTNAAIQYFDLPSGPRNTPGTLQCHLLLHYTREIKENLSLIRPNSFSSVSSQRARYIKHYIN